MGNAGACDNVVISFSRDDVVPGDIECISGNVLF